jgi:hypothetical protein
LLPENAVQVDFSPFLCSMREIRFHIHVQRAVVLAEGNIIEPQHLSNAVFQTDFAPAHDKTKRTYREEKKRIQEVFEMDYL